MAAAVLMSKSNKVKKCEQNLLPKIADFDRKVSRLYNLKHTYKQTLNDQKWQKLAQYNEREKRLKKTKKDKKRLKKTKQD